MADLTIKHLRYAVALADHRHFGRAADASFVSQPALSMQVRDLEERLGLPVFERGPRIVRLTDFGETLIARARDILRSVDELGDVAQAARGGQIGRLRLGVIPTVAPYLLPRLIGALTLQYPGLDLQVRETLTPRLIEDLGAGLLDAAIVALPVSEPALTEVPLLDEDFVLIRPAADAGRPVPDAAQLRQMRLLLLEEGHCFRDQALAFCGVGTARPREWLDGSALATLVQMVGAGIGVTLIPDMAVPVETRAAPVCVQRFAGTPPQRRIGMVWRRNTPLAHRLTRISEEVRLIAGTLPRGATAVGPVPQG
ncbi:transcriptional regulator, LysR family [Loktanella fryxellensis]|uniref:Transcriptional regulator, LysR family n=1 Tax=Loktanella fryxellensis TaxID=245187 RepID=A0A1H8G819_9RHOB|nr:LysR substrate-binding domain-containing protein [Loktanella fryxellensis]SEN40271.1 transcriptional regulator, LysR family [Loktanella fryxellensis]